MDVGSQLLQLAHPHSAAVFQLAAGAGQYAVRFQRIEVRGAHFNLSKVRGSGQHGGICT